MYFKRWAWLIFLAAGAWAASCSPQSASGLGSPTPLAHTPTAQTPTRSATDTSTATPTIAQTPTPTATASPSPFPAAQATCQAIPLEHTLPQPNLPANYIGKSFDSLHLPAELEFRMGVLIGEVEAEPPYGLTKVVVVSDQTHLLWFEELLCSGHADRALRRDVIRDVLVLPPLAENQAMVVRYCQLHGQEDPEIFAIGQYDRKTIPLTTIDYAWRANRQTKKFEVLPVEGITCLRDIGLEFNPD